MSVIQPGIILLLALLAIQCLHAQDPGEGDSSLLVPAKSVRNIERKTTQLGERMDRQSEKAIRRFEKFQSKLYRKLAKVDTVQANKLIASGQAARWQLAQQIREPGAITEYIPHFDSLLGVMKVLDGQSLLNGLGNLPSGSIKDGLAAVQKLQQELKKAEDIRGFLKEQQQSLRAMLEQAGLTKELRQLNKQVYYYSQQLKDYRALMNDPKKIGEKALALLSKTRVFQDFMKRNSILASLFRMPVEDPADPAYLQSLAGLQTRSQVNQLIQQQLGSGGPNAMQVLQGNIAQAQAQLQELKTKITGQGGGSSDDIMPEGFKPNNQKTKTFLQRLELGTNLQTQQSTSFFPVTSDIGLSVGYKLNDKSILGVGASYKMGWGQNFRHIRVSGQGAGLRSFVDWKFKGSFWLSGGYELNYRTAIGGIDQLKDLHAWQESGLLGLTKKFDIKLKFFKHTKLQLLWDFLSYRQLPRTQPILFRVGYGIQ
jgi:hypothetical protein